MNMVTGYPLINIHVAAGEDTTVSSELLIFTQIVRL